MNINYKLFFKYIFFNTNQIFLKNTTRNDKNTTVYLTSNVFYYTSLHLKLSTLFYSTQLIDTFAYETPSILTTSSKINNVTELSNNFTVYSFHNLLFNYRFFLFTKIVNKKNFKKKNLSWSSLNSISELFLNANWLERETAELHGIFFENKKDVRNLMLPYGDTTTPFIKAYPSIGLREIFYDSVNDTLTQTPVSVQF